MADVRLCFVGPMIGRKPGRVTTQGEILADLFVAEGWSVRETSSQPSRPVRLIDTIWCLLRWRRSIDLVVLSVFSGPAFVMADITSALLRLLGLPMVLVLHGGNLPDFERRHGAWVRRVLKRARVIVAPSTFLATEMASGAGALVIPNVVDLSAWEFRPRTALRPRILWMRTFHPLYNPVLAVRVLERLHRTWPDATLTMAGQEKGMLEATRQEVATRGLEPWVHFAGFLRPGEKLTAFADHDLYLHTNHVDNTPVSVLEAAAAGLPIVATRVGGMPYLLEDGATALLVADGDEAAMTAAIERLLSDPALAGRLSENGRALAERSAWPAVYEQWQAAFEQALHRAPSA